MPINPTLLTVSATSEHALCHSSHQASKEPNAPPITSFNDEALQQKNSPLLSENEAEQTHLQIASERNKLLDYVLKCAAKDGRIKFPTGIPINSLDMSQVNVSYVLDCLQSGKSIVVPLAWSSHKLNNPCSVNEGHPSKPEQNKRFSMKETPPLPPRNYFNNISGLESCHTTGGICTNPSTVGLPPALVPKNASSCFALLENPIGFSYPVHWTSGNNILLTEAPTDWRFQYTLLIPPYSDEYAESVYEMAMFTSRNSPESVKDALSQTIRPDLGISVRRHNQLVKFMTNLSNKETLFTFRLAFLEAGVEASGYTLDDSKDWVSRQQKCLLSAVQWAYKPNEKSVPSEWIQFQDAVNAGNYPLAREILAIISPSVSVHNLSISIAYTRLVSAALDSTDSHPDSVMSESLILALQWCGRELLGGTRNLWDIVVARAMWGWAYLAVGKTDHLTCILRRLERARRNFPSVGIKNSSTTTTSSSSQTSEAMAYWILMEFRARLKASLQDIHEWTQDRVISDAGFVAMAIEACTRMMDGEEITSSSTIICTAVLVSKKNQIATLLQKTKNVVLTSSLLEEKLSADNHAISNYEQSKALIHIRAFVPIWESHINADATVIRPALGTVLTASDARKCLIQPTLECLLKVIDELMVSFNRGLGPEAISFMKMLVNSETVGKAASNALQDNFKVSLNLSNKFLPLVKSWISDQKTTLKGLITRAIAADSFNEPVNENVRHTDSVLTVVQYSRTMIKTFFDLPVVCTCLISCLIQTIHSSFHMYAYLIVQPLFDGRKTQVTETIHRINNIVYLEQQWQSLRDMLLAHGQPIKALRLALGVRGFKSAWLSKCAHVLAMQVVEELDWTSVYIPVAKSKPLTADVVSGIQSAMEALLDLFDEHTVIRILGDVACLVVYTWIDLLWTPPRVYLDSDYGDVLESDIDALCKVFSVHKKILQQSSRGKEALNLIRDTRVEMEALMPIPSPTLVELIEDMQPRSIHDLAHRSKVARVLVFRTDSIAKAAVKKHKLESFPRIDPLKFKSIHRKKTSLALTTEQLEPAGVSE